MTRQPVATRKSRPASRPGEPEPPGRRERKKIQTRQALAAAGLRLFAERGFDVTTVEDITEAVDVSPRTFFRYFDSKEEVVLPEKSEILGRLRQALAERPPDEPPGAMVREALLAFSSAFTQDELEIVLLRARLLATERSVLARSLERQTVWEDVIAQAIAARLRVDPKTHLRTRVMATTAVAAVRAAFFVWVSGRLSRDFRDLVAEALDLMPGGRDRA